MDNSNTGLAEQLFTDCYREGCRDDTHVHTNVGWQTLVLHGGGWGAEASRASSNGFQSQVLLHQASAFSAITWCENENNELPALASHPTRVSYILINGRSKKKGGGLWRDQVGRRSCARPESEVFQQKAHMHWMLHIHPLLWLTDRKQTWSPPC